MFVNEACAPPSESAVDRQIVFPLSHSLQTNGERNGQPLLHDFTDDIQFMDIEETGGTARAHTFSSSHVPLTKGTVCVHLKVCSCIFTPELQHECSSQVIHFKHGV